MSTLPGRWALTMKTPVGSIEAEMTFHDDGRSISGSAAGRSETVPLHDIRTEPAIEGEHVTWTQSITRPMRLNLVFDVTVHGDTMQGHSRAGRLPRSTVSGHRLS